MRRLSHKIFLTIIVTLVMVVLVAGAAWRIGWGASPAGRSFEMTGELAAKALPPAEAPRAVQQQAIERLAEALGTDLSLYAADRTLIAHAGDVLPPPRRD